MNSYELSRAWFDWCFENPEKISPNHTAMYFFIIEHCNRLGWKEKFGLPMEMTKDAIGIKNYKTYSKTFNDLVEFGFIKVYQKSKNQYSADIIALVKNTKAPTKALTKATLKHSEKQVQSIVGIDKPNNLITNKSLPTENVGVPKKDDEQKIAFETFWDLYDKKVGDRNKCKTKWDKLPMSTQNKILEMLPSFKAAIKDKQFQPHATTFLNQERWNDEIEIKDIKKDIPPFEYDYSKGFDLNEFNRLKAEHERKHN
jgi:hypothetical protein